MMSAIVIEKSKKEVLFLRVFAQQSAHFCATSLSPHKIVAEKVIHFTTFYTFKYSKIPVVKRIESLPG